MYLANTLKEFRERHGLDQDQLAKLLETTQQTISNWETGTMPRSSALRKINNLLNTYQDGKGAAPLPPKPVFDPHVTQVNGISVASEYETRRDVAEGLFNIVERYRTEEPRPAPMMSPRTALLGELAAAIGDKIKFKINAQHVINGIRLRADYESAKVTAEIRAVRSSGFNTLETDASLFHLVSLREVLRRSRAPSRRFVLILVWTPNAGYGLAMGRIMAFAAIHDIGVYVAGGAEEAARLLVELENAPELDQGLFSGEEGDTDQSNLFYELGDQGPL